MYSESTYQERVKSFLVSADGKKLVVIGERYHYVFDAPAPLLKALSPELHPVLVATGFHSFRVDRDNRIEGVVSLALREDASPSQLELASEAGFVSRRNDRTLDVTVQGERYSPTSEFELRSPRSFNKEYSLTVTEAPTYAKTALKVAATPITVAADGVMFIGTVVLTSVFLAVVIAASVGR